MSDVRLLHWALCRWKIQGFAGWSRESELQAQAKNNTILFINGCLYKLQWILLPQPTWQSSVMEYPPPCDAYVRHRSQVESIHFSRRWSLIKSSHPYLPPMCDLVNHISDYVLDRRHSVAQTQPLNSQLSTSWFYVRWRIVPLCIPWSLFGQRSMEISSSLDNKIPFEVAYISTIIFFLAHEMNPLLILCYVMWLHWWRNYCHEEPECKDLLIVVISCSTIGLVSFH